jgi:hypothetical protein
MPTMATVKKGASQKTLWPIVLVTIVLLTAGGTTAASGAMEGNVLASV